VGVLRDTYCVKGNSITHHALRNKEILQPAAKAITGTEIVRCWTSGAVMSRSIVCTTSASKNRSPQFWQTCAGTFSKTKIYPLRLR
jgi:hypothetical protein